MTYLSKSWTPNDIKYSFTHCKAVMKLTVLNGLSLQTFISQCMISCNWQFQMGGPLPDLPIFIYYGYMCIVLCIYLKGILCYCVYWCRERERERERDLKWWNALHMIFPTFCTAMIYTHIYICSGCSSIQGICAQLMGGPSACDIYICSVAVCKASMLNWLGRTYAQLHCAMLIYLV